MPTSRAPTRPVLSLHQPKTGSAVCKILFKSIFKIQNIIVLKKYSVNQVIFWTCSSRFRDSLNETVCWIFDISYDSSKRRLTSLYKKYQNAIFLPVVSFWGHIKQCLWNVYYSSVCPFIGVWESSSKVKRRKRSEQISKNCILQFVQPHCNRSQYQNIFMS